MKFPAKITRCIKVYYTKTSISCRKYAWSFKIPVRDSFINSNFLLNSGLVTLPYFMPISDYIL